VPEYCLGRPAPWSIEEAVVSSSSEGGIEVEDGYGILYRVVGGGDGIPLLTLHGGHGAGHDDIDALEGLAENRPVVFHDQLGYPP
jgi:proline iminopeptidase